MWNCQIPVCYFNGQHINKNLSSSKIQENKVKRCKATFSKDSAWPSCVFFFLCVCMQNVFFRTCKHSLFKPTRTSKLPRLKKKSLPFKSSPETEQWNKDGVEGCLKLFIGVLGEIITTLLWNTSAWQKYESRTSAIEGILKDGGEWQPECLPLPWPIF